MQIKIDSLTVSTFSVIFLAGRLPLCRVVFRALLGAMIKCLLHCISLGATLDSSSVQAAGTTLVHHWWAQGKDRVNMLVPVGAAGDNCWCSGRLSAL